MFRQERGTSFVRIVAMLFESRFEQLVLDRHAAKNVAVGESPPVVPIVGLGEHAADLESASRPHDHAAAARIANRVDRREAADLAHSPNANQVIARHRLANC